MTTGTRPVAVAADGNVRIFFISTITLSAPTVAQLTAGQEMSYYLTTDGFQPAVDEQTITDERMGDQQTFENRGRHTYSLQNVRYVFNTPSAANDEAALLLAAGTTGYFVVRWGLDADTAWVAAQKIDIFPVVMGIQMEEPPETNTVLHIRQRAFVTGPVLKRVAVAA